MSAGLDCVTHQAGYRPGDHEDVVAASFACQMCLRGPALVLVSVDAALAIALCGDCGAETIVELTGAQVVALAVDPPAGLPVSLAW